MAWSGPVVRAEKAREAARNLPVSSAMVDHCVKGGRARPGNVAPTKSEYVHRSTRRTSPGHQTEIISGSLLLVAVYLLQPFK